MGMRPNDKTVTFEDVTCLKDTGAALLCSIDGVEVWIPQSQVHADSEVYDDGDNAKGTLVVSEWIALQKGLI